MGKKKESDSTQQKIVRLFSVEQAAAYLGISTRTIYNGIGRRSKNRFPVRPKRVGRSVKFDIRDLDNYVNSL